jgi:hypothetical protein
VKIVVLLSGLLAATLLAGGAALDAASSEEPAVLQGEFEALRAVLDAELEGTDYQRVDVGGFLRLPGDTRRPRERALAALEESGLEVDDALIESFRNRNRKRLELWGKKAELLGERTEPGVIGLLNPRHVLVQYGRMGGSESGDRGLVYLEMRPHDGAEEVTAVFRVVERDGRGWRVLPARGGFVRNAFDAQLIEE